MATYVVHDLFDICRTCLSKRTNLLPLTSIIDEENFNVKDYLTKYVQIDCNENDYPMPKNICLQCFECLLDVRNFSLQCQESEKYLKLKMSLPHPIKKEEAEIKYQILNYDDDNIYESTENFENVDKDDDFDFVNYKCNVTDEYESDLCEIFEESEYLVEKYENLDEKSEIMDEITEDSFQKSQKYDEVKECIICVACHLKFSCSTAFELHKCKTEDVKKSEIFAASNNLTNEKIPSYCSHKCEFCNYSFFSLVNLYHHIIKTHKDGILDNYNLVDLNKLTVGCSLCSKQYTPNKNRRKNAKKKRKNLLCELCGKVYHNYQSMKEHEFAHKGIKPYKCEYCDREFAHESIKRTHLKLHIGKHIKCSVCDKTFATASFLRVHMTYHTNDLQFPCDLCPKRFRRNYLLQLHKKRAHIGTKTEQCEYCDASFFIKDDLGSHISRVHLKRYHCNLCENRYSEPGVLRQHFLKAHNIEMLDVSSCKKKKNEVEILNRSRNIIENEK